MANETLPLLSAQNPGVALASTDIILARQAASAIPTMDSAITAAQIKTFVSINPTTNGTVTNNGSVVNQGSVTTAGVTTLQSGLAAPVRTVTGSINATSADFLIRADATTAALAVTLPSAPGNSGLILNIKKIDASANAVTLTGTVDGTVNPTITVQYTSLQIISNGTTWDKL